MNCAAGSKAVSYASARQQLAEDYGLCFHNGKVWSGYQVGSGQWLHRKPLEGNATFEYVKRGRDSEIGWKQVASGTWVDGKLHGHGSMTFRNGDHYTGNFKHGKRHGQGKLIFRRTGECYVGEFVDDNINGKGRLLKSNGAVERINSNGEVIEEFSSAREADLKYFPEEVSRQEALGYSCGRVGMCCKGYPSYTEGLFFRWKILDEVQSYTYLASDGAEYCIWNNSFKHNSIPSDVKERVLDDVMRESTQSGERKKGRSTTRKKKTKKATKKGKK